VKPRGPQNHRLEAPKGIADFLLLEQHAANAPLPEYPRQDFGFAFEAVRVDHVKGIPKGPRALPGRINHRMIFRHGRHKGKGLAQRRAAVRSPTTASKP